MLNYVRLLAFISTLPYPLLIALLTCLIAGFTFFLTALFIYPLVKKYRQLKATNAHWTELAREIAPIGRLFRFLHIFTAVFWGSCAYFVSSSYSPSRSALPPAICLFLAALLGSYVRHYYFAREIYAQRLTLSQWIRLVCTRWGNFLTLLGGFFGLHFVLERIFPLGTYTSLALSWFLSMICYFSFGWRIPLKLFARLREASSDTKRIVRLAAEKMSLPQPKCVYEVDIFHPNAFALLFQNSLAFSSTLLTELNEEEIAAIARHELSHLSESRGMLMKRYLPSLLLVPLCILAWSHFEAHYFLGYLFSVGMLYFLGIFQRRVSTQLEERADKDASKHEESLGVYAQALEKIYRFALIPAVMDGKNNTHPNLYDRMIASGVTPSYPRPKPPTNRYVKSVISTTLFLALTPALFTLSEFLSECPQTSTLDRKNSFLVPSEYVTCRAMSEEEEHRNYLMSEYYLRKYKPRELLYTEFDEADFEEDVEEDFEVDE